MPLLLLKIILAPAFVVIGTLAGRRWGPKLGGFMAGFPNTAGPILFFITLEQGAAFGARTAEASLLGLVALGSFALLYPHAAKRWPWWACLLAGWAAYIGVMLLLRHAHWPLWVEGAAALLALNGARWLQPTLPAPDHGPRLRAWDLPLRGGMAIAIVLGLTGAAAVLGPQWSGLLTPFPVTTATLAVFAQIDGGAAAAERVVTGSLLGLNAVAVFMVVVALALPVWGLAGAFAAGLLVGGLLQVAQYFRHR